MERMARAGRGAPGTPGLHKTEFNQTSAQSGFHTCAELMFMSDVYFKTVSVDVIV